VKLKYGWAGQVLDIDLTRGEIRKRPLDEKLALNFLGGRGLNGWALYNEVKAGIDPLGEENVLIFGVGPMTGTLSPGAGRFTVTSKSPLTGIFGDSSCGGSWGAELKFAGYDQVIIRGKAEKPVYLFIDGDKVQIRDARDLWGKDTYTAQERIKKELSDPRIEVACIGPAGEKLVKFATVVAQNRVAARTGMGCVMGSKNLKAVAIRGYQGVAIAKPALYKKWFEELCGISDHDYFAQSMSMEGTAGFTERQNTLMGSLASYNAQRTRIDPERARKLRGEVIVKKYQVGRKACFSCTVPCNLFYRITQGPFSGLSWDKIEFATIGRFTAALGIDNIEVALKAGALCDQYGMDSLSLGTTLAWLYECFEKNIVTKNELHGFDLTWGNADPVFPLIEMTANREGIGDILAEGVKRAAQTIGRGSDRFALHSKGMEAICADPRAGMGQGLSFAVSTRGYDHLRAHQPKFTEEQAKELFGTEEALNRSSTNGKGSIVRWSEDLMAVHDSLIVCKWSIEPIAFPTDMLIRGMNHVTGLNFDADEIMGIGERIFHVEKAFNIREGLTRKDDTLPRRHLEEQIPDGPVKGQTVQLEPLLDGYYAARGWDIPTGLIPKSKLVNLGLPGIADELENMGKIP
jgi:aldehyde:ferredoxin oxidoreductase